MMCLGLTSSLQSSHVDAQPPLGTVLCSEDQMVCSPGLPFGSILLLGSPLGPGLGRGWLWTCVGWSNLAFATTVWENGLSGTQALIGNNRARLYTTWSRVLRCGISILSQEASTGCWITDPFIMTISWLTS